MEQIIVTRHQALAEYIVELGLVEENTPIISHVTPQDVEGKHVLGFLPLHLALLAKRITIIPHTPPDHLRGGKEIDLETLRKIASKPITVDITRIDTIYRV